MALVMTPIYTQTVGAGGSASVTFNNIPQFYTDIKVFVSSRCSNNGGTRIYLGMRFNGSTSSYSNTVASGAGSSTSSGRNYTGTSELYIAEMNGSTSVANTFSNIDIYIPNYTSSNFKSFVADGVYENNVTEAYQVICAGLWLNTAAITSLSVYPGGGTLFAEHTTVSLYGIIRSGA